MKVGELSHYPKIVELHGQRCYLSGTKTIDRVGKMEFLILVSFNKPEHALEYYKQRWQLRSTSRIPMKIKLMSKLKPSFEAQKVAVLI